MTTRGLSSKSIDYWREHPTQFIEKCLVEPESGLPFKLFPAQRRFFKLAWQTGANGRLLYPDQVWSAPKKSAKTTLAALHELVTVLLFGGRNGEGVATANDLEQATGRVFEQCKRIVEASPALTNEAEIVRQQIRFKHGPVIKAIASDEKGAAGGWQNIASFDELWGFTRESSYRLWEELCPIPTKPISCRLVTTYAGYLGESVLLESVYERGMKLPLVGPDLRAGDGMLFYWTHEPPAPWQTEDWLAEMRRSLRPNQYLRMIENRWVSSDSPFIDMAEYDACVDGDLRPVIVDKNLLVWAAIDASTRRDSTAISVVTWDHDAKKARLVWHRIFYPDKDHPIDFENQVERTLLDLRQRFSVQSVLFDPFQLAAVSQRMQREGVNMIEFTQTVPNLVAGANNLYELIRGRNVTFYADPAIRLAFSRAVAVESARGWRIDKLKQSHKIDIVVSIMMAAWGAVQDVTASTYDTSYRWVDGPDLDEEALQHDIFARALSGYLSSPPPRILN